MQLIINAEVEKPYYRAVFGLPLPRTITTTQGEQLPLG